MAIYRTLTPGGQIRTNKRRSFTPAWRHSPLKHVAIPYNNLPAQSILLLALANGIISKKALRALYFAIMGVTINRKVRPQYRKEEIDSLFEAKVLQTVCGGRYRLDPNNITMFIDTDLQKAGKIDTAPGRLCDVLNNLSSPILIFFDMLKRNNSLKAELQSRLQTKYQQMLILENWVFWHFDELKRYLY